MALPIDKLRFEYSGYAVRQGIESEELSLPVCVILPYLNESACVPVRSKMIAFPSIR